MIIYGKQVGAVVSFAYLNKFIMHPLSSNKFELHCNHLPINPIPISDIERTKLSCDTLCLGHETIEEVPKFVCSVHPQWEESQLNKK
jgi:hypothetical protein